LNILIVLELMFIPVRLQIVAFRTEIIAEITFSTLPEKLG